MKALRIAALSLSCLGPTGLMVSTAALAQTSNSPPGADNAGTPSALSGWMFGYAPFDWHFSDARKENDFEPDEQKHAYVWLIQAEKELDERHIAGFAYFKNSFGQPSQYAYYGWRFRPFDSAPSLFIKITGGIIHGYKFPLTRKSRSTTDMAGASRPFRPWAMTSTETGAHRSMCWAMLA